MSLSSSGKLVLRWALWDDSGLVAVTSNIDFGELTRSALMVFRASVINEKKRVAVEGGKRGSRSRAGRVALA